jgi:outer membrane protein assembly factor BamB
MLLRSVVCLVLALVGSAVAVEPPATWLQWRGPTRDGQVPAPPPWPTTLETLTQTWRVALGPSYSGPIVTAERVFVTETRGKQDELVRALDRATGKELWRVEWPGALTVPFFAASNGSWIRSTPATDGERLYVAGIRDVLVCLNALDGKELWRVDFVQEYKTPLPAFGFVCSPLLDESAVYVQAGGGFVKLDKRTGKIAWRVLADEGGMMGSAFSSPIFATLAGQEQILVQTRLKLCGVERTTGKVLWEQPVPNTRGMNILTPTVLGDRIFTSTHSQRSFLYQISQTTDKWTVNEAWTTKAKGYMSSPVVINGHAYLHLQNQRCTCIRLSDGHECWTTDKPFGKYWSMVAQGERILALDERGILLLIRATPEKFVLLAERKIATSETWAHLAVCGQELFVRELDAMTAFKWAGQ